MRHYLPRKLCSPCTRLLWYVYGNRKPAPAAMADYQPVSRRADDDTTVTANDFPPTTDLATTAAATGNDRTADDRHGTNEDGRATTPPERCAICTPTDADTAPRSTWSAGRTICICRTAADASRWTQPAPSRIPHRTSITAPRGGGVRATGGI